ncbi:Ethylene-responsive transcription factor ERF011 [Platanthera zijinensis]|uniref:Ethylene-responsive transcription factor ERF011 n=1 Tax=Platanthera zijinensis TaxID=2320716 RepID=A0AAP0AWS1_9ASPA
MIPPESKTALRGVLTDHINFPEELDAEEAASGLPAADSASSLSAATIRKKATEVGARVDALQAAILSQQQQNQTPPPPPMLPARSSKQPDLNEQPSPEISDEE